MNKKKILFFTCIITAGITLTQSCQKSDYEGGENDGGSQASSFSSSESSGMQGNCMNCHTANGNAEGNFSVAGTAYDSLGAVANNAIVKLYTQPKGGGTLVATIQVDRNGNFYTTSPINMAGGLYPAISYTGGNNIYMPIATTSGACNSCHGVSYPKIWVK